MARRSVGAAVVLTLIAVVAIYLRSQQPTASGSQKAYVFINETTDHRFDESIRMSIVAAQSRTGVQNVVVITNDLGGALDPAVFTSELFQKLEVGRATGGRGILYLYSPEKKILKIEVSYGLEGSLTDLLVGSLERAAKMFVYADRYQDFWAELINTLNIEIANAAEGKSDPLPKDLTFQFLSGGAGVTALNYAAPEQLREELKDQQLKINDPNRSVAATVDQYFVSLSKGFSEIDSEILSRESLIARRLVPMTSFQLYRNWNMYRKVRQDRTFQTGNIAFVFFTPGVPVLPIVLKKQEGSWRIQEPMAWALFQRFEDSMRVFRKYEIEGLDDKMSAYLADRFGDPLYPEDVHVSLAELAADDYSVARPRDSYFHLFAIDRVKDALEPRLSRLSKPELVLLADSESNLGRFSKFLEAYRLLASRHRRDEVIQRNLKFYEEMPVLDDSKWRLSRTE